jgi:hypothetical protein
LSLVQANVPIARDSTKASEVVKLFKEGECVLRSPLRSGSAMPASTAALASPP